MYGLTLSPERGRWRRWAARAERHRVMHGRSLPLLPREPCWERRRPVAVLLDDPDDFGVDEGDIVRAYVTAYLDERCAA